MKNILKNICIVWLLASCYGAEDFVESTFNNWRMELGTRAIGHEPKQLGDSYDVIIEALKTGVGGPFKGLADRQATESEAEQMIKAIIMRSFYAATLENNLNYEKMFSKAIKQLARHTQSADASAMKHRLAVQAAITTAYEVMAKKMWRTFWDFDKQGPLMDEAAIEAIINDFIAIQNKNLQPENTNDYIKFSKMKQYFYDVIQENKVIFVHEKVDPFRAIQRSRYKEYAKANFFGGYGKSRTILQFIEWKKKRFDTLARPFLMFYSPISDKDDLLYGYSEKQQYRFYKLTGMDNAQFGYGHDFMAFINDKFGGLESLTDENIKKLYDALVASIFKSSGNNYRFGYLEKRLKLKEYNNDNIDVLIKILEVVGNHKLNYRIFALLEKKDYDDDPGKIIEVLDQLEAQFAHLTAEEQGPEADKEFQKLKKQGKNVEYIH